MCQGGPLFETFIHLKKVCACDFATVRQTLASSMNATDVVYPGADSKPS